MIYKIVKCHSVSFDYDKELDEYRKHYHNEETVFIGSKMKVTKEKLKELEKSAFSHNDGVNHECVYFEFVKVNE